jgi:flavin reductase (DIM6/NTAB) family NADH-FMN oxidoreductase RutF
VIFCGVETAVGFGTHTIFVGRVEATIVDPPMQPLVFQSGRMWQFLPFDDPPYRDRT